MKFTNLLKSTLVATLAGSVVACSPAQKNSSFELSSENSAIIGGAPVTPGDSIAKSTVAIVASVITQDDEEQQFICTGSLLTSNIVLTAAHCVPSGEEFKQVSLFVVFNSDLHKVKNSDIRAVVGHVIHPEYGNTGVEGEDAHDLALIKFAGFMAQGYQLATFLEDESLLKPGTKVTLAGYGLIETDGINTKSDDRLRKVEIEMVEEFGRNEIILDQTRGKGACHGDSGGPAFLEINGTQYVWGVTSRGAGQDGKDDCSYFSVYTKVKSESAFIDMALNKLTVK